MIENQNLAGATAILIREQRLSSGQDVSENILKRTKATPFFINGIVDFKTTNTIKSDVVINGVVNGDICVYGDLKINGRVNGNITCNSIEINQFAIVTGNIYCHDYQSCFKNSFADTDEIVCLFNGGTLDGSIYFPNILIGNKTILVKPKIFTNELIVSGKADNESGNKGKLVSIKGGQVTAYKSVKVIDNGLIDTRLKMGNSFE